MTLILDLAIQGAQMLLVLALAPLLLGYTRKLKARMMRRRGPPILQPYRDLLRLCRKDVVLAENASWLFRSAPYMIFAATWVAAALVPTFATGLKFSWTADLIAIIALLGSARLILGDPLQQVQRLLGHASLTTTYIYLDHIATRADTVDAAVEELLALLPGPQGV